MSLIRLSSLAVLSIESDLAESINVDAFVYDFDSRHDSHELALPGTLNVCIVYSLNIYF